jgi:hypothetical protein
VALRTAVSRNPYCENFVDIVNTRLGDSKSAKASDLEVVMAVALDRPALYYPYIHVRDLNWLKGSLLCFPQVRRILPAGFPVHDQWEVQEFTQMSGSTGQPLLVSEFTDDFSLESPIRQAQARLLKVLQDNDEFIRQKYALTPSPVTFHEPEFVDPEGIAYQIHTGKMMYDLAEHLLSNGLAAKTTKPHSYLEKYGQWVFVHHVLGEAIMSTIAIAIASGKGLDIVTSDSTLHHALAVLDEDEVLARLIGAGAQRRDSSTAEKVEELAELVMTTCFDLDKLSPAQIGELVSNGHDLRAFKTALIPIAESLPEIHDPVERERRLKDKTAEVMGEWKKYRKSLPKFALDALLETTELKYPELAAGIMLGGTGMAFASGLGLAMGLLTWKGLGIWRKYKEHAASPYSYLSKIERAGATLVFSSRRN